MPGDHDYLDPNFHSNSRFEMEQAARAREAAEWLGMDYVNGQLEDAGRSGTPLYRSEIIDQLTLEAFVRMDAGKKFAEPENPDGQIDDIDSKAISYPPQARRPGNVLEPTVESLRQVSRELYHVPVNVKRLLHLRDLVQRSVIQNQDGQWIHTENRQFVETRRRARTTQGDINRYVEDILMRSSPSHWFLNEEQQHQCEEILRARILSPAHTDPLLESERQVEARRAGRVYNPPVGEGLRSVDEDLDLVSGDAALWKMAARRAEREPTRPLLLQQKDGSPRSERDIVKDMSWTERRDYKQQKQNNEQARAAMIQRALKLARENGNENIWQHNVTYRTRERLFDHYEEVGHGRVHFTWTTRTTVTGKEVKLIASDAVKMSELLAWGKLEVLARMHLHNELIESREYNDRGAQVSENDRISSPYLTEITEQCADSYLEFLRKVAGGSEGTTSIQSPDFGRTLVYEITTAGKGRLNSLYKNVYIDDSIRETMPTWFMSEAISRLPARRSNE
jgi:hypothetical protein